MTPFHVGMKVVCVDDEKTGKYTPWKGVGGLDGLLKGVVYTVRYVGMDEYDSNVFVLKVKEIVRPAFNGFFHDIGYAAARFRPAHENRMDELRSLLVTPPSKAKTKKGVQA